MIGRAVLLAALLLQAVEFDPARLDFSEVAIGSNTDPAWDAVGREYRDMAMTPVRMLWLCPNDRKLVDLLSRLAYKSKVTFNSGNVMRRPLGVNALCERHIPPEQELDPQTIYIVDREYLIDFHEKQAVCGVLDGLSICVDGTRDTAFARALKERPVTIR